MKKILLGALASLIALTAFSAERAKPWDHGKLQVSENGRYLVHEDGEPFFWLGETAWLLTSRLLREEVDFYLRDRDKKGYNVIQVSIFHSYPQYNVYGECATPFGYDFKKIDRPGYYGYWNHVDYVIDAAAKRGMYVAIVCTWGSETVKNGHMNVEEAKKYAEFLAKRYADRPNIIWMIGGDVNPEANMDVWHAMAETIKKYDKNHLMTYHPVGRTSSANWFHDAAWLDFHMFQSGHRRYGQNGGQIEGYPIEQDTEEDNWRYVEKAYALTPAKPVIDGEPSYEGIPHGLHSGDEPYWTAPEIRRYAYWSVFAGSFGHTYGDNAVMQFYVPSIIGSFAPKLPWYEAMQEPGAAQMQHLKALMTRFPFTQGRPDQSLILNEVGEKYDRLVATRGEDYALVYTYTHRAISIDLDKIAGRNKQVFWFIPETGEYKYVGRKRGRQTFTPEGGYGAGKDKVLVVFDADKKYVEISAEDQARIQAENNARSDAQLDKKAAEWTASLNLNNPEKEARVAAIIATHQKAIRDWHNAHVNDIPKGAIDPATGKPLNDVYRQMIAISSIPASVTQNLIDGLSAELTPEQVEQVLDKHTVGKVAFTLQGYKDMFLDEFTPEDEKVVLANLKEARLKAMDYKNMNLINQVFEIYKTKNEQYFTNSGRDWKTYYKAWAERRKAEKAAKEAANKKQ
ncbi:MAG: DUF4038 domain-containing protein [Bacteroidales bacterium]|nr:DUF4038 domain-containing protein [Bacteroidales bacterium]